MVLRGATNWFTRCCLYFKKEASNEQIPTTIDALPTNWVMISTGPSIFSATPPKPGSVAHAIDDNPIPISTNNALISLFQIDLIIKVAHYNIFTMFRKYPKLFKDPLIEHPIYDLNLPFSDYINQYKKIIAENRLDLGENPQKIIDANAPFEFRPENPLISEKHDGKLKFGALMVHGLLDSCFIMRDIGAELQSQGMLVRSVLLPGHGIVPGALLNVRYEEWLQALRYGIASLKKEVDHIFLVGFSTGASLSLYHTMLDPSDITALIMLSPAFKIKSAFDFMSNWHEPISWAMPKLKWAYIGKEYNYTKYRSITFNSIYQVYRLTHAIKQINHNKKPPCPIFMSLSYDDLIVSSEATIKYFTEHKDTRNQMILYIGETHPLDDPRIIMRSAVYPEFNIINFSHIAIPVAPSNPHYGMNGDYPLASHIYEKSNQLYCALDKPHEIFYDVLFKLKLTHFKRERLTFNPDFQFMVQQMKSFTESFFS